MLLKETKPYSRLRFAGDLKVMVMKVEMVIKLMKMKGGEGEEEIVMRKRWWK